MMLWKLWRLEIDTYIKYDYLLVLYSITVSGLLLLMVRSVATDLL